MESKARAFWYLLFPMSASMANQTWRQWWVPELQHGELGCLKGLLERNHRHLVRYGRFPLVAGWASLSFGLLNRVRMDSSELNMLETWSVIGWEATTEGEGRRTGAVPRCCHKATVVAEHSSGRQA